MGLNLGSSQTLSECNIAISHLFWLCETMRARSYKKINKIFIVVLGKFTSDGVIIYCTLIAVVGWSLKYNQKILLISTTRCSVPCSVQAAPSF